MPSAGIIIIGNEILSGKITDCNSSFLCRELRELGVDVQRISVISDETALIAEEVRNFSREYDHVFTTGGVGPTHDDVTMAGVAAAFGQKLQVHEGMKSMLARAVGESKLNESQLKMATLPEKALLIESDEVWFPLVQVGNVYIFPGIPKLLMKKFALLRNRLQGVPFLLRRVYVSQYESEIAEILHALLERFPGLELGSYPRTDDEDYLVMLTLESRDRDYVDQALEALLEMMPEGFVLRVERE